MTHNSEVNIFSLNKSHGGGGLCYLRINNESRPANIHKSVGGTHYSIRRDSYKMYNTKPNLVNSVYFLNREHYMFFTFTTL